MSDDEELDSAQHSPQDSGMEVWRRMVARWEPRVPLRFRGMLQSTMFSKIGHTWRRRDTADNIVGEANPGLRQQSGETISDAIKL